MTSVVFFTVVLLVFYLHAYSCYCYSVVCLSCYLVILCLQLLCYYFVYIVYMHEYSSLHTLTRSLSDDPRFARPGYWIFSYIVQVSLSSYALWETRVSLSDSGILISLIFHVISGFYLYRIQLPFSFLYSSVIIVLDIHMSYCSDINLS